MVGHTGSLEATIKAVEAVDACTKAVVETLQKHQGIAIVLADHGNAEKWSMKMVAHIQHIQQMMYLLRLRHMIIN